MIPLSKAKVKLIRSLHDKKGREEAGLCMVEGRKMLEEALQSGWEIEYVIFTSDFSPLPQLSSAQLLLAGPTEFGQMSTHVNPEGVMTILRLPGKERVAYHSALEGDVEGPAFFLDAIQDPGNFGTILRTADWFGFRTMVCAEGTADCFNPKVLRASMGSVFRMRILYVQDFVGAVSQCADRIWAADMDGDALDAVRLGDRPYILLGNEAHGLSDKLRNLPGLRRITVPRAGGAESLNVAVTAGILAWAHRHG